jgi:hypothetical protein
MEQKDISTMSDLELAELSGQIYQQLITVQQNLQVITQEIQKRKSIQEKDESRPNKK